MFTTTFTDDRIQDARLYADEHARIDGRTHDPEAVIDNKAASRIGEQAAVRALSDNGKEVRWTADESEGEPPFDVIAEGLKFDVKCSTNEESRCNLMPGDRMLADGRDVDGFILVRISKDLTTAYVYGYVTVADFEERCHFFPPVGELRMMNDELTDVSYLEEQ